MAGSANQLVVVAVPKENDYVWKLSSEKVPHLTVLYLGDQSENPHLAEMIQFIQHVSKTMLYRFGLDVDRRGTLGDDEADVLFFGESNAMKEIRAFRDALLQDVNIQVAYNSTDQFPSYTPHLTMGYPTAPAKKDDRDYPGTGWVQFDRIQIWTGDSEGPEVLLEDRWAEDPIYHVDLSSASMEDVIAHYGVKGMRWGRRKNPDLGQGGGNGNGHEPSLTKKQRIKDDKWRHKVNLKGGPSIRESKKYLDTKAIKAINDKPEYKDLDWSSPNALRKRYEKEINDEWAKAMTDYVGKKYGVANPSGTKRMVWEWTPGARPGMGYYYGQMQPVDVKHSDEEGIEPETTLIIDEKGYVRGFIIGMPEAEHAFDTFEDFLAHYGVKGMKWGVRNDNGHEGERVKTKKLDKLDKKWERDMNRTAYAKLHNAAAEKMNNGGIDAINNSPKWKGVDFTKPENASKYDEYLNEHQAAFEREMVKAGPSLGMNPSGTKQFIIKKVKNDNGEEYEDVFLEPVGKDLKHEVGETETAFRLNMDSKRRVTNFEAVELELMHYGVKGMKWGVRKGETVDAGPTPVTTTVKGKGRIKTAGGQGNKPSDDAVNAAVSKQVAKKSSTNALSNKELQDLVTRMNLEQQYTRLKAGDPNADRGQKFAARLLGKTDKNTKMNPVDQVLADRVGEALKQRQAA